MLLLLLVLEMSLLALILLRVLLLQFHLMMVLVLWRQLWALNPFKGFANRSFLEQEVELKLAQSA